MHQRIWFNDPQLADREPEAALAYRQSVAAAYTLRIQQSLNEIQTMPRKWRDTFDMSDWALRLTPEEAASLTEDLGEVLARYRPDTPGTAESALAQSERVDVITYVLPALSTHSLLAGADEPWEATGSETS